MGVELVEAFRPDLAMAFDPVDCSIEHIRLEDARRAIKAFAALMLLWDETSGARPS